MNPIFFGDSYEFAKREIIHGLAPANEWNIHPMYFARPRRFNFASQYARFLQISVVDGLIYDRNRVTDVGGNCLNHILLDPDTGLWLNDSRRPKGGWDKHIKVAEVAQIATAPERVCKLTLVFDQSYSNAKPEVRKEKAIEKLIALHDYDVNRPAYAAAYISHAVFIWVSGNQDTVAAATESLRARVRVPFHRLIGEGL